MSDDQIEQRQGRGRGKSIRRSVSFLTHPPFSFSCFVTTRGCGKGSERDTVGGCKASKHSALAQCIREISALNLELGPELPMASENETGGGRRALPFFFLSFFGLSFWRGLVSWWVRFAQSADTCCLLPACLPACLPAYQQTSVALALQKGKGRGVRERERERERRWAQSAGWLATSFFHPPTQSNLLLSAALQMRCLFAAASSQQSKIQTRGAKLHDTTHRSIL